MELIDKDKLDDYKFRSASERMDLSVEYMSGWNDAIDNIQANAPRVDAKPVRHGKWIPKYDKWGDYVTTVECYECSACKETNWDEDKYCPWCGAKMDGEEG